MNKLGDTLTQWIESGVPPSPAEIAQIAMRLNSVEQNNVPAVNWPTPNAIDYKDIAGNVVRVDIALNGTDTLTTSHRGKFIVPASMNGKNLTSCTFNLGTDGSAGSSSSGSVTFSVQDGTQDMLTTNPSATSGNYNPTTAAVIDNSHKTVVTGDIINVEVTAAGTGVTYAVVALEFA
jgi:hypothetical protein